MVHLFVNGVSAMVANDGTVLLGDVCAIRAVKGDVFNIRQSEMGTLIEAGEDATLSTRLTLEGKVQPSRQLQGSYSFGGSLQYMVLPVDGNGIRVEQRGWTTYLYIGLLAGPRSQPPAPVDRRPLWRRLIGV